MTYANPHRPVIEKGQQYVQWTGSHQEAAQGMPPCAVRLWQNLLTKCPGGVPQEIDLEEIRFDISVGRSKAYSVQSLKNAMKCLIEKCLLVVVKTFTKRIFRVVANHAGQVKRLINKFARGQDNLTESKEICETQTSNSDAVVPSYREIKIQQTPDAVAFSAMPEYKEPIQPCPVSEDEKTVNESFTKTAAIDHPTLIPDERINTVKDARIPLNPTLCSLVMEYALDEVRSAIAHYREVVQKSGERNSPGGWLTDCLKGKWWDGPLVKAEVNKYPIGFLDAYERLIAEGIVINCDPNGLPLDGNRQPKVRVINELLPGGQELIMWRDAMSKL